MRFDSLKYVYLIGIGGIGMSGLARYFKSLGKFVGGYDKTSSSLTLEMENEGIEIHYEDNLALVNREIINHTSITDTLIIYTPAVPADHSELKYFSDKKYSLHKRAEVLGWITEGHYTVAVAGTHGKTTTSTLVAHILRSSGIDCMAFLGGVSKNYHTNILLGTSGNETKVMVVEADEYDRSFLTLNPDVAVITSIDPDHLDIYNNKAMMEESYALFANRTHADGCLITKDKVQSVIKYSGKTYSYSLDKKADYFAKNINIQEGHYVYDVVTPDGEIKSVRLGVTGLHNIENSVAATAVARVMKVDDDNIRKALGTFAGVERRFDYQIMNANLIFIDDYAHHPEEIKACLSSVRAMYPGKKITAIFQPHLYSRTRDFADGFATSLALADNVILLDIYPARELPIEGITSSMLLDKIKISNKKLCTKTELINEITSHLPEVLVTMGAGDIDRLVEPLKNALLKKTAC
jgi:UDP-N-acetylmuramate--alanine ligase